MKDDTLAIVALGGLGLYLYTTKGKGEGIPWLPEGEGIGLGHLPSIDLSGLLSGLQLGSLPMGGLPTLELPKFSGLGLDIPKPDLGLDIPSLRELLQGEKDTTIEGEATELTWSQVLKGFVYEHPILASAIAIPVTGAATYGAVKLTPYVTRGIGGFGRGSATVFKDIYSTIKFPKGVSIWKPISKVGLRKSLPKTAKAVPTTGVSALSTIGQILGISELAAAGATEISRLFGWKPKTYEELIAMGIPSWIARFEKAVEWWSIPETIRGFFAPGNVIAAGKIPSAVRVTTGYERAQAKARITEVSKAKQITRREREKIVSVRKYTYGRRGRAGLI